MLRGKYATIPDAIAEISFLGVICLEAIPDDFGLG